ncbi:hypothetical protein PsalN5692_00562 [Piscirickettsia salmonis]|nr:hypothetical protein PsalN5692_00562 [Piscirickettsia salmonis]
MGKNESSNTAVEAILKAYLSMIKRLFVNNVYLSLDKYLVQTFHLNDVHICA